jgi:DNA-binding XRE family transcriptional regulator
MTTNANVDFSLVEQLREKALLRKSDMAKLFGVSPLSYINWVKGKPIRRTKAARVSRVLSELVQVIQQHGWPDAKTARLTGPKRFAKLKELMPQPPVEEQPPVVEQTPAVEVSAESANVEATSAVQ